VAHAQRHETTGNGQPAVDTHNRTEIRNRISNWTDLFKRIRLMKKKGLIQLVIIRSLKQAQGHQFPPYRLINKETLIERLEEYARVNFPEACRFHLEIHESQMSKSDVDQTLATCLTVTWLKPGESVKDVLSIKEGSGLTVD
jgi:hypothetical protein